MIELITLAVGVCIGVLSIMWKNECSNEMTSECQHDTRMTLHSEHRQICYDCGESMPLDDSYYPRHQR